MVLGTVARVVIVIFTQDCKVLERFMFDVSSFPSVPVSEIMTPLERADTAEGTTGSPVEISIVDVEEQLRATVRKLAYCGSKLEPLPAECTYTVCVELKDTAEAPIGVST